jgi:hypothetical protein
MMTNPRFAAVLAWPFLLALAGAPAAHAQQDSTPPSAAQGNKASKPPVEEAASRSGVATRKPAKAGAQSGPATPEADAATAAQGNKAGKPPVDHAASRAGMAADKPAKSGTQAGPASAPQR